MTLCILKKKKLNTYIDTMKLRISLQYSVLPTSASLIRIMIRILLVMNIIAVHTGGSSGVNVPFLPPNETIPAVLVFGDSVVDTGNNNYVQSMFPVRCDFPPYGKDFNGGKPTGRYSNGRVPSDMLAEILNVKKLLPPYLDPNLKLQDLLTGVSFASGAGGYDPLTSKLVSVLSLSDQLKLFKEYKAKLRAAVGETKTESIVSKSVYILCTGSDDIANTYFSTPFRRPHYDIPAYTDLMLQSGTTFLQELYGEGARRIGVLSLPPIGCLPSQRTLRGGLQRECSEPLNQAAILFNSKLSSKLLFLNQTLPESTLIYFDIYNPLLSLIQDPFGFEEATKGCCGTGTIEVSVLCNRYSKTCSDASKYIFWDSFHPTEKAYDTVLRTILNSLQ